jgi:hypothetical protein
MAIEKLNGDLQIFWKLQIILIYLIILPPKEEQKVGNLHFFTPNLYFVQKQIAVPFINSNSHNPT